MATYEGVLRDISAPAVIEAAQRFTCGDVPGQNKTFAPSIAEFCTEARRIADVLPYRNRQALPAPERRHVHDDRPTRIRMGFKLSVLSASLGVKHGPDMVSEANKLGLDEMIALAQRWNVPVPEEVWAQRERRVA